MRVEAAISAKSSSRAKFATALLMILAMSCDASVGAQNITSKLAGKFGGQGYATYSLCFNQDLTELADCSTAPVAVATKESVVFQITQTAADGCQTLTETFGPLLPSPPVQPATSDTLIFAFKITSYDSSTQTGTSTATVYPAGSGTFCRGSSFVNTGGADPLAMETFSFVVSQGGNRIDSSLTSVTGAPINFLADFVETTTSFRQ
jgi:hypothetical protein